MFNLQIKKSAWILGKETGKIVRKLDTLRYFGRELFWLINEPNDGIFRSCTINAKTTVDFI